MRTFLHFCKPVMEWQIDAEEFNCNTKKLDIYGQVHNFSSVECAVRRLADMPRLLTDNQARLGNLTSASYVKPGSAVRLPRHNVQNYSSSSVNTAGKAVKKS